MIIKPKADLEGHILAGIGSLMCDKCTVFFIILHLSSYNTIDARISGKILQTAGMLDPWLFFMMYNISLGWGLSYSIGVDTTYNYQNIVNN